MANTIQRFQVADYIAEKSETPDFKFMGVGFTQLDENPKILKKSPKLFRETISLWYL